MKKWISIMLVFVLLPAFAYAEYAPLFSGSKGEEVRKLQNRLNELGINAGKADGSYGSKTRSAVSEAQRLLTAAGYDVAQTGSADEETLRLIYDAEAEDSLRTLRRGSSGDRVRELQTRLLDLKLLDGYADGDYGGKTEEAVLLFQQKMAASGVDGLPQDGIASPQTLEMLMSDLTHYFVSPLSYDESEPLFLTPDHLYSEACILIDAPSGEILFQNNADRQLYPASTTKMMTLLLALEEENLDQIITIPDCASDVPADSSLVPVYPGEKMTMRDLLHGLMLRSGNDAANAVAEITAGSLETFVELMNARAAELGMNGTHFVNPHGYHDENHYSTARDLAILAREGLTHPAFCQIATCLGYTMSATSKRKELYLPNTYEIFDPASDYYIEGAAGVKSGYTSLAGFCYAGAAQRDGKTLIAVILGVSGRNRGWTDLKRLFEYGFAQ